ncbi:hypothetical protein [Gemmatimonas sp.]|uniref:hypothetical protein n=1 Tax=Gemmatimonas sp. TaxID=1962908 RepID=UPI00356736CF
MQTYRLLRDRRRSGAVAAAIPVIIGVASTFRDNAPIGWLNLLGSLLGLVMLATVWKELELARVTGRTFGRAGTVNAT